MATQAEIKAVETLAAQEGKSEIEILSMMQAVAAKSGDEATLERLCQIKTVFVNRMMAA